MHDSSPHNFIYTNLLNKCMYLSIRIEVDKIKVYTADYLFHSLFIRHRDFQFCQFLKCGNNNEM